MGGRQRGRMISSLDVAGIKKPPRFSLFVPVRAVRFNLAQEVSCWYLLKIKEIILQSIYSNQFYEVHRRLGNIQQGKGFAVKSLRAVSALLQARHQVSLCC